MYTARGMDQPGSGEPSSRNLSHAKVASIWAAVSIIAYATVLSVYFMSTGNELSASDPGKILTEMLMGATALCGISAIFGVVHSLLRPRMPRTWGGLVGIAVVVIPGLIGGLLYAVIPGLRNVGFGYLNLLAAIMVTELFHFLPVAVAAEACVVYLQRRAANPRVSE